MEKIVPSWGLTARWVFPIDAPPIERGVVRIACDRIHSVGPPDGRADIDLGNVAVLPGLVNAHAHLDLTGLRGQVPFTGDFTDWLRAVIAHRRQRSAEQVQHDIQAGIRECLEHGVTLVGDISDRGCSIEALATAPLRAVVFYELLGLTAQPAGQSWAAAMDWLALPSSSNCRRALSPHAPYSVRRGLLRAVAARAATADVPVMIHLAETQAELQLLAAHDGPFRRFLEELGVWGADGLVSSPAEVVTLFSAVPHVLLAHGNFLGPNVPLGPNTTVVYCPRTHHYFGHPPHPFRQFLERGARVALGTDSLASSRNLDLLQEVRFLHQQCPNVPGAMLLRMATVAGAEALGWADETGSLTPGKSADLIVVPLPPEDGDPHHLLLGSDAPAQRTLFRGRWASGGGIGPAHLESPSSES
jgi:cytosine/adenosine deaminase-related metal-dependent hydrolase